MNNIKIQSIRLSEGLLKENNNIGLLRILAASLVIFGHAYAIQPQPPHEDPIKLLLHFDHSGSLAVKFFFFISGLLLADSIRQYPDALNFMLKRAFRIFPGLLFCLMLSVLLIGPIFSNLQLNDYFSQRETWTYLTRNSFLLDMQWRLPGVFSSSYWGLNGSLWTLPFEFLCCFYLALFSSFGLLKNRIVGSILCIFIITLSMYFPEYLPPLISGNPEAFMLPGMFALGAFFGINKHDIKLNFYVMLFLWIVVLVSMKLNVLQQFFFYFSFCYSALYVATHDFVNQKLRLPFDASYGVYIYGFVVQQSVNYLWPNVGVYGNQILSLLIVFPIALFSWYVIEEPAIRLSTNIIKGGNLRQIFFGNRPKQSPLFLVLFLWLILFGAAQYYIQSDVKVRWLEKDFVSNDSEFVVVSWGPLEKTNEEIPNVQPDGTMGLFINVNKSSEFTDLQVIFDRKVAKKVSIQEKIITAAVPSVWIQDRGEKQVVVKNLRSGKVYYVGTFQVR